MQLSHVKKRTIQIRKPKKRWVSWLVYCVAIGSFLIACTAPLWFGRVVRQIVPPRYIAAYAPLALQEYIYSDINAQEIVPTAAATSDGSALLAGLATSTPVIGDNSQTLAPNEGRATLTSTELPQPTASPTPSIPSEYLLTGFTYAPQGWNNCGPATLTMALSYWGIQSTQDQAANFLKGNREDVNVSPSEIPDYVASHGYQTLVRVNGSVDVLRQFIAAGYPVVIERGFDEEPDKGWMGHYMLIVGYSDVTEKFAALDSYWGWKRHGFDEPFPVDYWDYERLDDLWRHFNRTYYVVYPPQNAAMVAAVPGLYTDDQAMYAGAVDLARTDLSRNPDDLWGWFNLGAGLTGLGDYQNAALAFDQTRAIGLPRRMLWYHFEPYQAYLAVGRYDDVIELATWTLNYSSNPQAQSEEAWYYRGQAVLAQGDAANARYFFNQALERNAHFQAARQALEQLNSGQ
ncbi:MAG: C39 family peptidase [Anaerolineae bacterium]|nr:C39 family peptidase [Anaerolineae bacterium]